MFRIAAILAFTIGLAACSVVDTLTDGFKHTRAVESALETSVGVKPQVGFNWSNGRLRLVSVTFPRLIDTKPVRELAEIVRRAVTSEFKQTPDSIVLGFNLGKSDSGTTAQAE